MLAGGGAAALAAVAAVGELMAEVDVEEASDDSSSSLTLPSPSGAVTALLLSGLPAADS